MIHGKYVEVEPIIMDYLNRRNIHVFYFCGGRGIGKTYGGLDMLYGIGTGRIQLDPSGYANKFLYLRRSEVEAKSIANPSMNPFKKYNKQEGHDIIGEFNDAIGIGNFYEDRAGETIHLGYAAAVSTFSNLRGVDFSDVIFILYDECVPESKRKRNNISDEGFLLLNLIETINRNRALEGEPEIVLCMLSNPIDLGSILLSQLGFTEILNNMIFANQQRYTDVSRSLHIERYEDHEVSLEKAEKSMLYKFSKGLNFNEQTISGKFTQNDLSCIRKDMPMTEFKPLFTLENLCVYKHKSNDIWYISRRMQKCKHNFKVYQQEALRETYYWGYKTRVINECVFYDNYQTRVSFNAMINYKSPF